jgi:hypothetical protein
MSEPGRIVICKPIGCVGNVEKPLVDARFGVFKNSTGPLENFLEPFQIGGFRKIAPERTVILRGKEAFKGGGNSGLPSTGSYPQDSRYHSNEPAMAIGFVFKKT